LLSFRPQSSDTLRDEPGEENSQATQVAVNSMPGQPSILSTVQEMIGETAFPLQIENELPDFMLTDLSCIFASPFGGEEVLKVTHAVADDGDGIGAFPFGSGTELIPYDKVIERC